MYEKLNVEVVLFTRSVKKEIGIFSSLEPASPLNKIGVK